jgi:hypothetical protein
MVSDMADNHGPIYRVVLKNNSPLPVFGLRVSLIAVLGSLDRNSPAVTAELKEIAAGGVAQLDISMPVAVMTLGPQTQQVPFETLVAAIDSFNELNETSELNNVLTLTRTNITVIESVQTAATTTTTVTAAAGPAIGGPAAAGPAAVEGAPAVEGAAGAPGAPAIAPMEAAAPMGPAAAAASPQDSALENLNLDNVENASAPE